MLLFPEKRSSHPALWVVFFMLFQHAETLHFKDLVIIVNDRSESLFKILSIASVLSKLPPVQKSEIHSCKLPSIFKSFSFFFG